MEVICLDEPAFHALVQEVVDRLKAAHPGEAAEDKWIGEDEAMRLLRKTSKSTLQILRDTGKIEYSQWNGKNILYDRQSILDWLETNRKTKF